MTISIFSRRQVTRQIGALEIDATISENHSYTNEVTDYPVEDGFNIQDHVQRMPERLTMQGIITLTPLDAEDEPISREDSSDRVQNAYNTLLEYAGYAPPKQPGTEPTKIYNPQLLDIVTGVKTYTDMVIVSLQFPFNKSIGQSIRFTAEFKKIKKVQPELTFVPKVSELNGKAPNIENQAAKVVNAGKQQTGIFEPVSFLNSGIQTIKGGAVP